MTGSNQKWRVFFNNCPPVDVYACDDESARRTGRRSRLTVGIKGKDCRVVSTEFLHEVGYDAKPGQKVPLPLGARELIAEGWLRRVDI